jgi:hypothetical protein
MITLKLDKSLTEVFEWREQSQTACEGMSTAERMNYIHQKAQAFMQRHHLNLVTMDSRSRTNHYSTKPA